MSLKLYDNPTTFYKNFLARFFDNIYESLSFYDFLGKVSNAPVVGVLLKPFLDLYASRLHAAALPLPVPEIINLINEAKVIAVDECVCRNLWHNCDRERSTCFKINTSAEAYAEGHKNSLITKEEAIRIVRSAAQQGLVTQLESCMPPYNYSICCCCRCCCVAMRLRYDYGIYNAMKSGYYIPEFDKSKCTECGTCVDICPPKALKAGSAPELHTLTCLGCGLCAEHCPSEAITMAKKRQVKRIEERPNLITWLALWAYVFGFMIPTVVVYSLFTGRKTKEFGKLAKR
ncbi:MAG: 4Fe-4S binding protein [Candidatus Lindowbacteria bacterium]|nr:4Fe-4S binding protein [Candidatus Lindowbacteria bacterium]